jgi:hypothetical protein
MKPRDQLKQAATTLMRAHGFQGSFPHFRKIIPEIRTELVTFQIDRHGLPKFVVEVGAHGPSPFNTPWGELIETSKLTVISLPTRHRLRLGAADIDSDHWFQIDDTIDRTMQSIGQILETQGQRHFDSCVS